jgi:ribosome-binding ATPase
MKIGIVGYQGSGKSSLFEWLTGTPADPALAHTTQREMVSVPDRRVPLLCDIYSPKKVTLAQLELVDTPGLTRTHEGNAARLGLIREAGCLIVVVAAFDGSNPETALRTFDEDLLLADLEIISGRVDRLRESVKKPRPNRDEELAQLAALEPLVEVLESGQAMREIQFTDEQRKATRSFQLLTEKPRLVVINVADDEEQPERFCPAAPDGQPTVAIRLGLERELARMEQQEREQFLEELGLTSYDRDALLAKIMEVSGQMLYFTAGEKEVRTWMIRTGGTAVEAADLIHSDLARGFIRAETMNCDDLIRVGSEREMKAQNLVRQEPKDYVLQDGDILNIRFSV